MKTKLTVVKKIKLHDKLNFKWARSPMTVSAIVSYPNGRYPSFGITLTDAAGLKDTRYFSVKNRLHVVC